MPEPLLKKEDILRILPTLDFLGPDCWLTSGAALVLFGVKETTRDIDLICTAALADRLEAQGYPFKRDGMDNTRIFAVGSRVEVLEDWQTDEVVQAEGYPAASLASIRKQKAALGREKDWADIALIDQYIKEKRERA